MPHSFTPGPWLLRTTPTSAGLCHIVSAADWRGAFIYGDGIRKGVDDALPKAQELAANARLMAAAPDLLDALQAMVRDYGAAHASCGDLEMSPALLQAQQAISRAIGDQL